MSYRRSYSGSVHYSGTESYSHSYPASENGGTVHGTVSYSGYVPVEIDLYVDTDPFDYSVDDCRHSVSQLNGAVVAMNSAQVASIHKASKEVSNHVISGFFNMIKSELDQNIAALAAKFKAVFELLVTKSSTLEKQQIVMQDDYTRISSRYGKIFQNLDEELEKRVIALDKNVFNISKKIQGEQLYTETSKKVTQFLLGINEDEIVQQQLLIANAKSRVQNAIDRLAENVIQEAVYSKKVNSIVTEKNCPSSQNNYIPVIFTESSNLEAEVKDYNCFSNPLEANSKSLIGEGVKNYFVSNSGKDSLENEAEQKQINEAFSLIAEKEFQDLKDEKSVRVYEVLKKLKEA